MPHKAPTRLSALLVEDDRDERRELRALVEKLPGIGDIHEATTVEAALSLMPLCKVLFIDIAMGRQSGFTVAEQANRLKQSVIFTTAHKEHALRAFELNATDFLLKPIDSSRLQEAWTRAQERLLKAGETVSTPRFALRGHSGTEFLPVPTLISVNSEGNYLRLCLFGRPPVIIRETFEHWMESFPKGSLIEAGRGRAVNRHHILSIEGPHNDRVAVLSDGRRIRVSRRRASDFEKEAAVGADSPGKP